MITRMPARRASRIATRASGRGGSIIPTEGGDRKLIGSTADYERGRDVVDWYGGDADR